MKLNKDIEYKVMPYGTITTIPMGTNVIRATNHPDGGYWVSKWDGMSDRARDWNRNYGFHISDKQAYDDVEY